MRGPCYVRWVGTLTLFDETGFAALPDVLTPAQCGELITALDGSGSGRAGSRNLLDIPECERLAATLRFSR